MTAIDITSFKISAGASSSKGGPIGTDTSTYEDERGEVLIPTVSAIEAVLGKYLFFGFPKFLISSSFVTYQGVPHVLLVRGKPQGTGVR